VEFFSSSRYKVTSASTDSLSSSFHICITFISLPVLLFIKTIRFYNFHIHSFHSRVTSSYYWGWSLKGNFNAIITMSDKYVKITCEISYIFTYTSAHDSEWIEQCIYIYISPYLKVMYILYKLSYVYIYIYIYMFSIR
jgi:hypothetical protein